MHSATYILHRYIRLFYPWWIKNNKYFKVTSHICLEDLSNMPGRALQGLKFPLGSFQIIVTQSALRLGHIFFQSEFFHMAPFCASTFNFQYLSVSLKLSSSCLSPLLQLLVPSFFPLITCFRWQFLFKTWPIHSAFPRFISFRMFLFSLTPSYFWIKKIGPTNLLHPSPAPLFQNFQATSDLFSDVSKIHHYKEQFSNYNTLPVCSSNFSPFCWSK